MILTITRIKRMLCLVSSVLLLFVHFTTVHAQQKQTPIKIPFNKESYQSQIGSTEKNNSDPIKQIIPIIKNEQVNDRESKEILSKRTRYSKHLRENNGQMSVLFGGNYHYKDIVGNWQNIDLNVVTSSQAAYKFENTTNNVKTYFPNQLNQGIKMVNEDGQTIDIWKNPNIKIKANETVYTPQQLIPTIKSANAKVKYHHLHPGITQEFEILNGRGVEHNIIIENMQAFGSISTGTALFTQFIPLEQGTKVFDATGKEISETKITEFFSLKSPSEANYIQFGQIVVFDNTATKDQALSILIPEEKWTSTMREKFSTSVIKVNYNLTFVNGGLEIAYELPMDWLKQPHRSFPVVIDPEIIFTPSNISNNIIYETINNNWYGYQRVANLYLESELNFEGNINSISFNRQNDQGIAADVPTTVYLKTTNATELVEDTWNSTNYSSGAISVFDNTFNVGTSTGWKTINLSSPFNYTGDNLMIMIYDRFGTNGSSKRYAAASNLYSGRSAGIRADYNDPGDNSVLTEEEGLAEIKIDYTPTLNCTTMDPISISAPITTSCANIPFLISSTGLPIAGGIDLNWERSTDGGTTWSPLNGLGYSITIADQTEHSTYRLTATCSYSTQVVISNEIEIALTAVNLCYCTPNNTDCSDEYISNVSIGAINNSSTCSPNGYHDYTTSVPIQILNKEIPIPVSITSNGTPLGIAVMIDYNQDGVFSNAEVQYIGLANYSNPTVSSTIIIPATALNGITRMRIRGLYYMGASNFLNSSNPGCELLSSWGETEDYIIEIDESVVCTGTPTASVLTASTNDLCALRSLQLTHSFENPNSQITYTWQMSQDNGVSWNNFGPINYVPQITVDTITVPTIFQVLTTCLATDLFAASNQAIININEATDCYCEPITVSCSDGDLISSLTFATINNNTGSNCNNEGYYDYSSQIAAPDLLATLSYPLTVTKPQAQYAASVGAWIDYNHNGIFDAEEFTFVGYMQDAQMSITAPINIPADAEAGETRMRVRLFYNGAGSQNATFFTNNSNPSCNDISSYGETEDYKVNIQPAVACSGTPNAAVLASATTIVCADDNFTISVSVDNPFSGITYQWQTSIDGGATWAVYGNTTTSPMALTVSQSSATSYRLTTTCINLSETVISNIVSIDMQNYEDCYCTPDIEFNCTDGDLILNVTFVTINNTTTCSPGGYGDFTNLPSPNVYKGESYSFSATVSNGWTSESIGVWIDFNKDGIFDSLAGEFFPIGTGVSTVLTNTISIPTTAVGGLTRMRVVNTASVNPLDLYSCGPVEVTSNYGEMEDYLINIVGIDSLVVSTQGNIPSVINLPQGNLQLSAVLYPAIANQAVTWSLITESGNATINQFGMVTAIANGTVWGKAVSIEDPAFSDSILITITNQVTNVDHIGFDQIEIYPNPTKDAVNIVAAVPASEVLLTVMDAQGKAVATQKTDGITLNNGYTLNLGNYANGVYIIQLTSDQINIKRSIVKQ